MNRVEAQKNLKLLEQDKARLLSLNHLNSTWAFKNQCEMRVKQINEYVKNIELGLNTTYRQ
ncbi:MULTISPECIES: hypothetical protein [Acinetobacter]|uniref:hypothetical protein n=1 Tax=Acinetobacter TaxID=469 RepID=UPI00124D8984|nr:MULTISPECIES: hypothetical protein [Acinetobacter]MBJ9373333.1 hypothetical protein [Acinetobacter sp. TGL-Y2]MDV8154544.1 hypothetical protein [Acinetobacter bereziniae]